MTQRNDDHSKNKVKMIREDKFYKKIFLLKRFCQLKRKQFDWLKGVIDTIQVVVECIFNKIHLSLAKKNFTENIESSLSNYHLNRDEIQFISELRGHSTTPSE